jgi:hypothetical protein
MSENRCYTTLARRKLTKDENSREKVQNVREDSSARHSACDRQNHHEADIASRLARTGTSLYRGDYPGPMIEIDDHLVPGRNVRAECCPERLRASRFERFDRNATLLDPGVVAEIEDPRLFTLVEFEHVIG